MRPYGVKVIPAPDVADIKEMGSKTSVGQPDGHSYFRNAENKARVRRYWARKARAANKAACREES